MAMQSADYRVTRTPAEEVDDAIGRMNCAIASEWAQEIPYDQPRRILLAAIERNRDTLPLIAVRSGDFADLCDDGFDHVADFLEQIGKITVYGSFDEGIWLLNLPSLEVRP